MRRHRCSRPAAGEALFRQGPRRNPARSRGRPAARDSSRTETDRVSAPSPVASRRRRQDRQRNRSGGIARFPADRPARAAGAAFEHVRRLPEQAARSVVRDLPRCRLLPAPRDSTRSHAAATRRALRATAPVPTVRNSPGSTGVRLAGRRRARAATRPARRGPVGHPASSSSPADRGRTAPRRSWPVAPRGRARTTDR